MRSNGGGPNGFVPAEAGFIVPVGSIGQPEDVQFDLVFSSTTDEAVTIKSKNYRIQGWTR